MKYLVDIDGTEQEVEFSRSGNAVKAEIGGRSYELEISEPGSEAYLIKDAGQICEAFVSKTDGDKFQVSIAGNELEITVSDPKRLRTRGTSAGDHDGIAEIRTAMPGKVVRVLVSIGDTVEKDDGVIVVEAMKMQNELKSPKNGTVREIHFEEGSTVSAGDILISIE